MVLFVWFCLLLFVFGLFVAFGGVPRKPPPHEVPFCSVCLHVCFRCENTRENQKTTRPLEPVSVGGVRFSFVCFLVFSGFYVLRKISDPSSASMDTWGLKFAVFGLLVFSRFSFVKVSKKKQIPATRKHVPSQPGHFIC